MELSEPVVAESIGAVTMTRASGQPYALAVDAVLGSGELQPLNELDDAALVQRLALRSETGWSDRDRARVEISSMEDLGGNVAEDVGVDVLVTSGESEMVWPESRPAPMEDPRCQGTRCLAFFSDPCTIGGGFIASVAPTVGRSSAEVLVRVPPSMLVDVPFIRSSADLQASNAMTVDDGDGWYSMTVPLNEDEPTVLRMDDRSACFANFGSAREPRLIEVALPEER